jgi:hypothetical protein
LNRPAEDTDPHVVVHVDAVLAVNCLVAFSVTVAEEGEIVTAKAGMEANRRQQRTTHNLRRNPMDYLIFG